MGTVTMALKRQKEKANLASAKAISEEYQPENISDMTSLFKDVFGSIFEAMLQGKMNAHLEYARVMESYRVSIMVMLLWWNIHFQYYIDGD